MGTNDGVIGMKQIAVMAWALLGVLSGQAWADTTEGGYPIAGTQPFQRPAGGPVIREVQRPQGWYTRALTGVSQPYPSSLRFLEDQGNWYTPFIHPGMTGRYDIRGWHGQ